MSKFTKAPEDLCELVAQVAADLDLERYGIDFETLCVQKAKEVVSIAKANAIAEYLCNREDLILVVIYEKCFERVDEETKKMWIRMALDQITYDFDKDKLIIGVPSVTLPVGFVEKYKDKAVNAALLGKYTIAQIEDEEKQKKAEKAASKKKKKDTIE